MTMEDNALTQLCVSQKIELKNIKIGLIFLNWYWLFKKDF